ncbi:MAG: homocysteine S-methyltransferase family protein [Acidimicrobiia bacterium]|nr:homocysteine S-methyltransferase family protein [Acidimicrobiia bacterium]
MTDSTGRTTFTQLLDSGRTLVADGGMGTLLMERGLEVGGCPELLNVERPDIVAKIQKEYVTAGADIVLTNTFGGNRIRLGHNQLADRVIELNHAGVEITRGVAAEFDHPVAVAGSIGPTGELFTPYGNLEPEEALTVFEEQAVALEDAGVDAIWIETMSGIEELDAAFTAASSAGLPIATTMSFDTNGWTMMGVAPQVLADWAAAKPRRPAAVGANCGIGPEEAIEVVGVVNQVIPEVAAVAKANCGLPYFNDEGDLAYPLEPVDMTEYATAAIASGARIIGACCGSTPAHVAAIRAVVNSHNRPAPSSVQRNAEI